MFLEPPPLASLRWMFDWVRSRAAEIHLTERLAPVFAQWDTAQKQTTARGSLSSVPPADTQRAVTAQGNSSRCQGAAIGDAWHAFQLSSHGDASTDGRAAAHNRRRSTRRIRVYAIRCGAPFGNAWRTVRFASCSTLRIHDCSTVGCGANFPFQFDCCGDAAGHGALRRLPRLISNRRGDSQSSDPPLPRPGCRCRSWRKSDVHVDDEFRS